MDNDIEFIMHYAYHNCKFIIWGSRFSGGGAVHFVILSGEKRRVLNNGLSEIGELSRRI